MTKSIPLAVLAAFVTVAAGGLGCDGNGPNTTERSQLAQSRQTWSALKGSNGPSYRYTNTTSSFTGWSTETTIEVATDVVVRRSFMIKDDKDAAVPDQGWIEEGATLSTHQAPVAAQTIEQVYDDCEQRILSKDPAANFITLTVHDDGLLAACSYFPKNCADDCAVGYDITSVTFL
jgi:hypothetical protein